MRFHIVTLFPDACSSYLGESILKRAIEDKKISVSFYNPRDFVKNKWRRIDRAPYGGGPGMVIEAEPVIRALAKIDQGVTRRHGKALFVWLSPSGKQFTNDVATTYAGRYTDVIFICGRYEGIDARVKKVFRVVELSVGPFVLTGGELPAMLMIDVISRQIPGVLGDFNSREESRIASPDVYTRPEVFIYKKQTYRVPKILLSGHRAKIEAWKAGKLKN